MLDKENRKGMSLWRHMHDQVRLCRVCTALHTNKKLAEWSSLWVCNGHPHTGLNPERWKFVDVRQLYSNYNNNKNTPLQKPALLWASNSPFCCVRDLCVQTKFEMQVTQCSWIGIVGKWLQSLWKTEQQKHSGTCKIFHDYYYHYCPWCLVIKDSDFGKVVRKQKPTFSITEWLWPLRNRIKDATFIIFTWSKGPGFLFSSQGFVSKWTFQFHKGLGPKTKASNENQSHYPYEGGSCSPSTAYPRLSAAAKPHPATWAALFVSSK